MIDKPHIVQSIAQRAAVIHMVVPRADMMRVMGPAVTELVQVITSQGSAPAGPMFSYHLRRPAETFDFMLGFPVVRAIEGAGRVTPGELPSERVARTVYHGSYEGLPGAWAAFHEWIDAEKLLPAETLWESYLTGPHSSEDASTWMTELNRPLHD